MITPMLLLHDYSTLVIDHCELITMTLINFPPNLKQCASKRDNYGKTAAKSHEKYSVRKKSKKFLNIGKKLVSSCYRRRRRRRRRRRSHF